MRALGLLTLVGMAVVVLAAAVTARPGVEVIVFGAVFLSMLLGAPIVFGSRR